MQKTWNAVQGQVQSCLYSSKTQFRVEYEICSGSSKIPVFNTFTASFRHLQSDAEMAKFEIKTVSTATDNSKDVNVLITKSKVGIAALILAALLWQRYNKSGIATFEIACTLRHIYGANIHYEKSKGSSAFGLKPASWETVSLRHLYNWAVISNCNRSAFKKINR